MIVRFPTGLYSLDTIKKAAYRLSDAAIIDIAPGDAEVSCTLSFVEPVTPSEAQQITNAFKVEVLDQDLRATVATETAPMRNAILAFVFSKTGLQGE